MEYDKKVKALKCCKKEEDEYYTEEVKEHSLGIIERLSKIKISSPATINRLIEITLGLEKNRNQAYYKKHLSNCTRKTLNCLYRMDKEKFLNNFI